NFTTANEIHVPVGVPVTLDISSADVIHSVWIPRLQSKMDAIPGRENHLTLQGDRIGTYRGECAEFCGLEHAHMNFVVVVQSQADFDAWLARQRDTPVVSSPLAMSGQQLFLGSDCVYCHTVAGTNASGTIGPDLTHVAGRLTL